MGRSKKFLSLLAGTLLISFSAPAVAVEKPPKGSLPIAQGPILDPESGSYFELRLNSKEVPSRHWGQANRAASSASYKDRRGRLAVIKDIRTLNFVRDNFRFNQPAWIGLRFYCGFRKLVWVTGEIQPIKSPGMWAQRWHRTDIMCGKMGGPYMPVYLTDEGAGPVAYFQASGGSKAFNTYLIEYPDPAKEKGAADSQASKD